MVWQKQTCKVQRIFNGTDPLLVVPFPDFIVERFELKEGDNIIIEFMGDKIVMRKRKRDDVKHIVPDQRSSS